jgi:hypothetical protein
MHIHEVCMRALAGVSMRDAGRPPLRTQAGGAVLVPPNGCRQRV